MERSLACCYLVKGAEKVEGTAAWKVTGGICGLADD
jgi:hypothetical protein